MNFIDTHFHLDLWDDPKSIVHEIEKNKIYTIAVTNAPSVFFHTLNLTAESKYIRPAIGFHPELVFKRRNELPVFLENLSKTRYIGEVGLDYRQQSIENKKEQRRIFEKIIVACSGFNDKVLTVHSRGSFKDIIDIIGNNFPSKIILHWYSGSLKELEMAVEYGFYFSINFQMTVSFKGAKIIKSIPIDRILTESDGPYVKNNDKICSPMMISEIVKNIAVLRNFEYDKCKNIIYKNFHSILTNGFQ